MKIRIGKYFLALCIALLTTFLPGACNLIPKNDQANYLSALKQLHLNGRLVFNLYEANRYQLTVMNLETGDTQVLFNVPSQAWLQSASISPDGKQILMAYAPPTAQNQLGYGLTDLYLMPVDGSSSPLALATRQASVETYSTPTWSPDGQMIYYTHTLPGNDPSGAIEIRIERMKLGGSPQVVLNAAEWPRFSPDGSQIAYLSATSLASNELYIAQADGSGAKPVFPAGEFSIVDDHLYTPDGKAIIFSSITNQPVSIKDGAKPFVGFGVTPVVAHPLPSDWYQVNLDTGRASQLTHIQDSTMNATFSPDGQWLAYVSQRGIFVMKPDGSNLTQISNLFGMGSINWLP